VKKIVRQVVYLQRRVRPFVY